MDAEAVGAAPTEVDSNLKEPLTVEEAVEKIDGEF